jgi:hypothetical protein
VLVGEDAVQPVERIRCVSCRGHGADVTVLVLVVACLVGASPSQSLRDRGRFQPDGGHVLEVDELRHAPSRRRSSKTTAAGTSAGAQRLRWEQKSHVIWLALMLSVVWPENLPAVRAEARARPATSDRRVPFRQALARKCIGS